MFTEKLDAYLFCNLCSGSELFQSAMGDLGSDAISKLQIRLFKMTIRVKTRWQLIRETTKKIVWQKSF